MAIIQEKLIAVKKKPYRKQGFSIVSCGIRTAKI